MEGMLSQDEIDSLLEQTREVVSAAESARSGLAEQDVKLYDFKRPEKFSREQIRSLERVHERLARLLSQSLSAYIRTNVNVKMESVTPLSYQDFVFSLPQPTLIQVVQLDPLPGQAAVEMNPSVVFPMFEQMTGGKSGGTSKARPLTDVELAVFQRPLERIMAAIAEAWQDVLILKPIMLRAEQDPQFASVAAVNAPVVVVSLEVTMGEEFGMMSICMPDVLVDALLHYLGQERILGDRQGADREGRAVREALWDVPLPLIAELGRSQLSVRQLRSLRVDDVIRLGTEVGQDIVVRIGNRSVFRAQVGQLKRRLALRIAGPLSGDTLADAGREAVLEQQAAAAFDTNGSFAGEPAEGVGEHGDE